MPDLNGVGQHSDTAGVTNWAFIDRQIMENYSYTLPQVWDLTLPEIAVHLEKLGPTVAEPEWFVREWRMAGKAGDYRGQLEALERMMEE